MNRDRQSTVRRPSRNARFEWSVWFAAAFVLLVVAPALHAQQQQFSPQSLAPLYAALMPPVSSVSATPASARAVETALAVFECVPRCRATTGIEAPQLSAADGSVTPEHSKSTVEIDRTLWSAAPSAFAPAFVTTHVVLSSALTAHEAGYRSGQRNNRSHE
jgi:hypothetical protein